MCHQTYKIVAWSESSSASAEVRVPTYTVSVVLESDVAPNMVHGYFIDNVDVSRHGYVLILCILNSGCAAKYELRIVDP